MYKDTIVAIATPLGYGGIGVVRISGSDAKSLLLQHTLRTKYIPWKLHRTPLVNAEGDVLDDILAVYMPAPNTFTGEDVVELHCHGSPVILHNIIQSLVQHGARTAEKGEFSKRALLNNRISITQAEAIIEVIHAPDRVALSFAQKRLQGALGNYVQRVEEKLTKVRMELYMALDFPEEDLDTIDSNAIIAGLTQAREDIKYLINQYQQNTVWQDGATVVLAGSVNAGKSSLFNTLLGKNRAIVSEVEGTTRDYVTEKISLEGMPLTLIDTAGIRSTDDSIEQEGIDRMKEYALCADVIIFVIDGSRESLTQEEKDFIEEHQERILFICNKIDKASSIDNVIKQAYHTECLRCSTKTLEGMEYITHAIKEKLLTSSSLHPDNNALVPNTRQYQTLCHAYDNLEQLSHYMESNAPLDAISAMLEYVLQDLQEITGYRVPEDVLNTIFSSFCIGK